MSELAILPAATLPDAFAGEALRRLEAEVLPPYVERQRWFGGKALQVTSLRIADWGAIGDGTPVVAIAEITTSDGTTAAYALLFAALGLPEADGLLAARPLAVVARLGGPGGPLVVDGLTHDDSCRALLRWIEGAGEHTLQRGRLAITRNRHVDPRGADYEPVRRTGAEQSNSSVVFGRSAILKLYRRLQEGTHPEIELGQFLWEAGYPDVPALLASVVYRADGEACAIAVLHSLVANARDGWEHALEHAGDYYARLARQPAGQAAALTADGPLLQVARSPLADEARTLVGSYLDAARTLGAQTAELHVTLSGATAPDLAPEPLSASDVNEVVEGTRTRAARGFRSLAARRASFPDRAGQRAGVLLARQPDVFDRLDAVAGRTIQATRTRCHQDYHLGQVLWTPARRYALLDFEGEPLRPLRERRAKRSPLTDVAGMLRSYSYAAWSALFAWSRAHGADPLDHEPWAALWEGTVSAEFLRAYLAGTSGMSFIPPDDLQLAALLDLLILDKAIYELEYELNNRPDWISVPVEGILTLIG